MLSKHELPLREQTDVYLSVEYLLVLAVAAEQVSGLLLAQALKHLLQGRSQVGHEAHELFEVLVTLVQLPKDVRDVVDSIKFLLVEELPRT